MCDGGASALPCCRAQPPLWPSSSASLLRRCVANTCLRLWLTRTEDRVAVLFFHRPPSLRATRAHLSFDPVSSVLQPVCCSSMQDAVGAVLAWQLISLNLFTACVPVFKLDFHQSKWIFLLRGLALPSPSFHSGFQALKSIFLL